MKKRNIITVLIFLVTASLGVVKTYGETEAEQVVLTTVQPSVTITKLSTSKENDSVNPETGSHTNLVTNFELETNGNDAGYDFIIQSSIQLEGRTTSAYTNNGAIMFGETLKLPSESAVENARTGGTNNPNVIVYPVKVSAPSPITTQFLPDNGIYGNSYSVLLNGSKVQKPVITHTVIGNPVSGSYNIGQDQAGTYQAVVTFTAVSK